MMTKTEIDALKAQELIDARRAVAQLFDNKARLVVDDMTLEKALCNVYDAQENTQLSALETLLSIACLQQDFIDALEYRAELNDV